MKKDTTTKHKEDPKGKRKLEFCTKSKLSTVKLPLTGKTLYLDIKDNRNRRHLEEDLKKLGATVEEFLSKDLNYLVTSQPRPKDKDDSLHGPDSPAAVNTPSPFSCGVSPALISTELQKVVTVTRGRAIAERARLKASVSSVLENAEKWGVKIVSVEAAVKWIEKELKKLPKEETAKHISAKENQRHKPGIKIKKLQSPFLKFEALNQCYRPCHSQLEAWPRVNTDTRRGTCPFDGAGLTQDEPSREERGELVEAAQLDALIHASPKEGQEGSFPGASTKISEDATLQFGGGRLITSRELRRRTEQKRRQERKRGFCECCNIKYEDLDKHVQEQQHWRFARDKKNFTSLDTLISSAPSTAEYLQKVLMGHIQQINVTRQPESDDENVDLIVENQVADDEQRSRDNSCRAEGIQHGQHIRSPRLEKKRQNSAFVSATVEEKTSLSVASDSNRIDGREGILVHDKRGEMSQTEGRKSKRLANSGLCGTVVGVSMELEKGPCMLEETGSDSKADADKAISNEQSIKMESKDLSVIESVSSTNKHDPENDSKDICSTRTNVSHKMSPKITNTSFNSVKPPLGERQSKIVAEIRLHQNHFQDEDDDQCSIPLFSKKLLPTSKTVILDKQNDAYSSSCAHRVSKKSKLVELSNIRNDSKKMAEDKSIVDDHQIIHDENNDKSDEKNSEKEVDLIHENQEAADDEQRSYDNLCRNAEAKSNRYVRSIRSPRLEKKRQNSALVTATVEEKTSLPVDSDSSRIDGREHNIVHETEARTLPQTEGRKSKRLANSSLCGTVVEAYIGSEKGPNVLEKSGFNSKPDADKAIFNEESFVKMECKGLSVKNMLGIGKPGLENASKSICITRKDVGHKMSPKITNTALNSVETPMCERQSKITAKLRLQQSYFQDEDEDDDESTFSLFSLPKSDMVTLAKENGAYSPSCTHRASPKSKLFELSNTCSDSKKISEDECTVYENQSIHYENNDKKNSSKDNLHTKGRTAKSNCYNGIRKKKGRLEVVNNKTKDSENVEPECEITKNEEESKCNTRLWSLTGQTNGQIETMMADDNVDSVAMLNCAERNPNQREEEPSITQKGSRKKNNGTLHQDKINNTDVHEDSSNNKGLFKDMSINKDEGNIDNENYKNSFTEKTGRVRRLVQKSRDNDLTFNVTGNVVCNEFVSNLVSPIRRGEKEKGKDILKNTVDEIHDHEADLIAEGISGHKVHNKEHTETRPLGGRDLKVDLNEATLIVDGKNDTGITKVIEDLNDGSKTLDPLAVFISRKNTKSKDKIMRSRSKKNTTKQNGETSFDRNIGVSKEFVQNSCTESLLDGITPVAQYSRSLKKEGVTQNKDSEIQIAKPSDSSGANSLVKDGNGAFSKIEDKNKSARFDSATSVLHDKFKFIDFKVSKSHFNAKGAIDSFEEISDKMEGSPETLIFRQSIAELAKLRRQNRTLLQNLEAKDDIISQVNSFVVNEVSINCQNLKKTSQHSKHRSSHTNQRANKRSWLHSGRNGMYTATGIDKMELSANKVEALVLETDIWNSRSLSSAKSSTDCVRKLTKKDVSKRKCAMLISTPRKRKLVESDAVSTKLPKHLVHGARARSSQSFSEVTQKTYQENRSQSPVFNKSPKLRHVTATQQLHTNDYYDTEMLSDTVIQHVQTDLCDFQHLRRSRNTSKRFTTVKTDENDRDIKLNLKRLTEERKVGCLIPNKVWTPRKFREDENVISSPQSGVSYSPRLETLRRRSRPKADYSQIVLSPGKSRSSPRSKKNLCKSFSDRIDESELEARQSLSHRVNYADNIESLGGSTGSQKSLEEKRRTFRKVPDSKEQKYETHCSSDKSFENQTQQIKKKRKLDQFKFEIQGNRDNEGYPSARNPSRRPEKIKDCDSYQTKILDVQGSESLASKGSETVVNYKVNSQQSCLETSSRLVTLGKRGLNENVTNKTDSHSASDVTKPSVSNNHSKAKEKDKSQNVSIMDEDRKLKSLKWSLAGFNVTSKKKVKLKRQWSLLSKRSAQAIFKDEDDRSSFAGFTEEEVSANLSLPSHMSFENCSEVSFDEKSHEDWVIDDEEKLETQRGTGNIVDFSQFMPAPFSSPGKHSSSSWDDACEDYLNKSIKHVTPLGKFWLKSPHKSPGKLSSGLLISVPEDGSGPESAIFQTPQKDRSRKNKNTSVDVPSVEKIDDDIEFNYLSPQKMQSSFNLW